MSKKWGKFRTKKEMQVGLKKLPVGEREPINYKSLNTTPSTSGTGDASCRYTRPDWSYKKNGGTPKKATKTNMNKNDETFDFGYYAAVMNGRYDTEEQN